MMLGFTTAQQRNLMALLLCGCLLLLSIIRSCDTCTSNWEQHRVVREVPEVVADAGIVTDKVLATLSSAISDSRTPDDAKKLLENTVERVLRKDWHGVANALGTAIELYLDAVDNPRTATNATKTELSTSKSIQADATECVDTVQVVMVSGNGAEGNMTTSETIPMLKSILQRVTCPIHFTIFTGGGSFVSLKEFFARITTPKHPVYYTLVPLDLDLVRKNAKTLNLKYQHHSQLWGLAKFFYPKLLPSSYHHIIAIDTDYVFGSDICDLWRWGKTNVIDMGKMHASTVPRGGSGGMGLCSCISIFNLDKMRTMKWTSSLITAAASQYMEIRDGQIVVKGDQTLNVAIARYRKHLFQELPRSWSLNLCQKFFGLTLSDVDPAQPPRNGLWFGAVHFNCPWHGKEREEWQIFLDAARRYQVHWLNGDRKTRNCFELPFGSSLPNNLDQ